MEWSSKNVAMDEDEDDEMPDDRPNPKRGPLTKASAEEVRKMTDIDFRVSVRDSHFALENSMANIDHSMRNHVVGLEKRMDRWEKLVYGLLAVLGLESVALLFAGMKALTGIGG